MCENISDVEPQQVLASVISLYFGKLSAPAFVVSHMALFPTVNEHFDEQMAFPNMLLHMINLYCFEDS